MVHWSFFGFRCIDFLTTYFSQVCQVLKSLFHVAGRLLFPCFLKLWLNYPHCFQALMILLLLNLVFFFTLFCFSHLYFPLHCLFSVSPSIFLFFESLYIFIFVYLFVYSFNIQLLGTVQHQRVLWSESVSLCLGRLQSKVVMGDWGM